MTSSNFNEDNLRQREQALRQKEQEIRLRELELEVNDAQTQVSVDADPPLHKTVKHRVPQRKKNWLRKIPKVLKFGLMVFSTFLVVMVVWRITSILVPMIMVGAIGFIGYKLYLDGDDD